MKVVFLCAGYGTRLYPLTEDQPKALLSLGHEPLLDHLLGKIKHVSSLESIVIVSNGRFYGHFCRWRETRVQEVPLTVINDGTTDPERRLGAIQDLKLGLEKGKPDTDVLVVAGDNFFDAELAPFLSFAERKRPFVSVGVYDVGDRTLAQKYGLIKTDSSGKITAFFEKPKDPETTLASMGIYYLPVDSLHDIDRYLETSRNPDAPVYYISWLAKEVGVFAYRFSGAWFDIGDLNSYYQADQYLQVQQKKRKA